MVDANMNLTKHEINRNKIYVRNLPPAITEPELELMFSLCGDIKSTKVYHYGESKAWTAFAVIHFRSKDSWNKALHLKDSIYQGYKLFIDDAAKVNYAVSYTNIPKDINQTPFSNALNTNFPGKWIEDSIDFGINVGFNDAKIDFVDEESRQLALSHPFYFGSRKPTRASMDIPKKQEKVSYPNKDSEYKKIIITEPRNVPFQKVEKMFALFGPMNWEPQHNSGHVVATFHTKQGFTKAMLFNNCKINGEDTSIRFEDIGYQAKSTPSQTPSFEYSIRVTNIGSYTENELEEYFCDDLSAVKAVIPKNEEGCAYVSFKYEKDQRNALNYNGKTLDRDPITVIEWKRKPEEKNNIEKYAVEDEKKCLEEDKRRFEEEKKHFENEKQVERKRLKAEEEKLKREKMELERRVQEHEDRMRREKLEGEREVTENLNNEILEEQERKKKEEAKRVEDKIKLLLEEKEIERKRFKAEEEKWKIEKAEYAKRESDLKKRLQEYEDQMRRDKPEGEKEVTEKLSNKVLEEHERKKKEKQKAEMNEKQERNTSEEGEGIMTPGQLREFWKQKIGGNK